MDTPNNSGGRGVTPRLSREEVAALVVPLGTAAFLQDGLPRDLGLHVYVYRWGTRAVCCGFAGMGEDEDEALRDLARTARRETLELVATLRARAARLRRVAQESHRDATASDERADQIERVLVADVADRGTAP